MIMTHGNTHDGDKQGKAILKSEIKNIYVIVYAHVAMHKRDASNSSR
jgi:hypothetical protein